MVANMYHVYMYIGDSHLVLVVIAFSKYVWTIKKQINLFIGHRTY